MSSDVTSTKHSFRSAAAVLSARGVRAAASMTICLALSACVAVTDQSPILADTVKPAPKTLVRMFANHTEDWGRGSGSFYGSDGTWRAVNTSEQSLGVGRWYVTDQSKVCTESTWYWRQDFGTETGGKKTSCRSFRKDSDGQLWSTTKSAAGPWFPFSQDSFRPGNQISAAFAQMAAYLKVAKRP